MEGEKEIPVRVAVRVRPFIGKERVLNPGFCLSLFPEKKQLILGKDRNFSFDLLFTEDNSQETVYNSCVKQLVKGCFDGYNATVFAYGQTGSGKTYTMGTGDLSGVEESKYGILPRAIYDIFDQVLEKQSNFENKVKPTNQSLRVKISVIEVYMEEVRDLLNEESTEKELRIQEDENGNLVISGLQEKVVTSIEEVRSILEYGAAARHTGNTKMNEDSSRSHCIFTISIEQFTNINSPEGNTTKRGKVVSAKLKVVDLAGSERAHRTGNQGERFKESVFINTGLLALGNVISALSDTKRKNSHIPYRDSKLTRLLKESLGGNSNTLLITCLSPSVADFDENLNSLKFSSRARTIKNAPVINQELQQVQVNQMKDEIAALREELQRHNTAPSEGLRRTSRLLDNVQNNDLQNEIKRCQSEIKSYINHTDSAAKILTSCERTVNLTKQLHEQIHHWRLTREVLLKTYGGTKGRLSGSTVLADVLVENLELRNHDLTLIQQSLHEKLSENDALKIQVDHLLAENSRLLALVAQLSQHQNDLQISLEEQLQIGKVNEITNADVSFIEEKKLLQSFRARSEVLLSRIEDRDEVCHDLTDTDADSPIVPGESSTRANSHAASNSIEQQRNFMDSNLASEDGLLSHHGQVKFNLEPVHPNVETPNAEVLLHEYQQGKEQSQRRIGNIDFSIKDFSKQIYDLSSIIKQKEELIRVISENEKNAQALTPALDEKFKVWKKEIEKVTKELEDAQQRLREYELRTHATTEGRQKIENEYQKKIADLEEKLQTVAKNQKDAKKLYAFKDNNERKIDELEGQVERLRGQHDQLQRKLKEEKDKKLKLEAEVKKGEQRIKDLQLKTDTQQRVLKRKTEEVAVVQRKLRIGSGKVDRTESKIEEQKKFLDDEMDKMLKQKEEMNSLENDLKRREEILKKREALLVEKGLIEYKKVRSSQVLFQDIIRLSARVDDLNQGIMNHEEKTVTSRDKDKAKEELSNLLKTKAELEKQQHMIEKRLESGHILDDMEEQKFKEVVDAIEALDAAVAYKNELINERQNTVRQNMVTEDWINSLLSKLGEISLDESKALLRKYLEKVTTLKESESKAKLEKEMCEVQIEEQEHEIHQLRHFIKLSESRATKLRVDQQLNYEGQIQLLLSQLREASEQRPDEEAIRLQDRKIHHLEKELFYYKKTCRDLKKKFRELGDASIQSSIQSSIGGEKSNTDRGGYLKASEKPKSLADGTKDEFSKATARSSKDGYRARSGGVLDDTNTTQSNEISSLNALGREIDLLLSRSKPSDTAKEETTKLVGPASKDGCDMFRLPPVQSASKDTKGHRERTKEQNPGLRSGLEKQTSDDLVLKDIFESHLSQRSTRKDSRQQSEYDGTPKKRSHPKDVTSSKLQEDTHDGNPW